jgi:hypothetical protein
MTIIRSARSAATALRIASRGSSSMMRTSPKGERVPSGEWLVEGGGVALMDRRDDMVGERDG